MPRCTKCYREITSLNYTVTGALVYKMCLDKQGDLQYEQREFEPDTDINKYLCPECNEILSTSELEATAFLKRSEAPKGV